MNLLCSTGTVLYKMNSCPTLHAPDAAPLRLAVRAKHHEIDQRKCYSIIYMNDLGGFPDQREGT